MIGLVLMYAFLLLLLSKPELVLVLPFRIAGLLPHYFSFVARRWSQQATIELDVFGSAMSSLARCGKPPPPLLTTLMF